MNKSFSFLIGGIGFVTIVSHRAGVRVCKG